VFGRRFAESGWSVTGGRDRRTVGVVYAEAVAHSDLDGDADPDAECIDGKCIARCDTAGDGLAAQLAERILR
jgi:hypothetical protein